MIRVGIVGAAGRMGGTACRALTADARFQVVLAVGRVPFATSEAGIPIEDDLERGLDRTKPEVLLELTTGATAGKHAALALFRQIPTVIGATGISTEDIEELRLRSQQAPCLLVPNFALGAVLMMQFSELASRFFPDASIIEMHHERKHDAPSGTAMSTARRIAEARTSMPTVPETKTIKAPGARGASVNGVEVHSVRLPGLLAHQEVRFGGQGEVLTIKHDSFDRSSFEAGIVAACEGVLRLQGFHEGLEAVLAF